jgi:His-Xaa-Ser system protein HxsD
MKLNTALSPNETVFTLDQKIYAKDVVFRACYVFIDRAYIHIDHPARNEIKVSLKGKEKSNQRQLESLKGDFLNELLNVLIRKEITSQKQKILEYIVGGAIIPALEKIDPLRGSTNLRTEKIKKNVEALMEEIEADAEGDYQEDPLGIKKIHEAD